MKRLINSSVLRNHVKNSLKEIELKKRELKKNEALPETKEDFCFYHGKTTFKRVKNRKGYFFTCYECLKINWRKAKTKSREKPEKKAYMKQYTENRKRILNNLSTYLILVLYVSDQFLPKGNENE